MADPSDMNAAFQAAVSQKAANEANTAAMLAAVEAKRVSEEQAAAAERAKAAYGEQAAAIEKARAATIMLGRSLRDGTAVRAARDMARLNREAERYRREVDLRARYGRVGGFIARNERPLSYMHAAASRAMGTTNNLYSRGMAGTVEQGRRELELNLLGREVAAIFKPVSDATTDLIKGFRKLLGGLGEGGQNALLAGGLGVTGVLGAVSMARGGGGLGKLAIGGGAVAGVAGGMGVGDVVGMGMAARWMWGGKGGAASGGGDLASAMKGKMFPGGGGPGFWARGGGASTAGLAGVIALGGASAYQGATGGFYSELRARGHNRLTAGFGALGGGFMDIISQGTKAVGLTDKTYGEAFREKYPVAAEAVRDDKESKRRVMMQGGGFQEMGSGYDQIAEAFGRVYGGDESKKEEGLGKVADLLSGLTKMLEPALRKLEADGVRLDRARG